MPQNSFQQFLSWPSRARRSTVFVRLAELGTQGYPPEVTRRLKILNLVAYLIAASTLAYAIQHIFIDVEKFGPVILLNLFLVVVALLVPLGHRVHEIAGGLMIAIAEFIALFLFMRYLGRLSGVHLQYFVGAAAPFLILGLSRLPLIIALVSAGFALHITSWFLYPPEAALITHDADMLDALYVTAASTTFVLIAATVYYAYALAERAQAETDALLRNILPESVVDRLKADPEAAIADSFEETSVLFADLKGFVPTAHKLGPQKTVALLNEIVSEFDKLVATHGAEKIKTIGDAYMAAAGVPEPAHDHADRLARLAFAMLDVVARIGTRRELGLEMRIGIASGPVMAGIIGTKRLTYDVWGDTVNMAARLESLSEPGRIQISAASKSQLSDAIATEPRGTLEIRGVGRQETWFLVVRQPDQPTES